tara:strand:- start:302 stop:622 length:321 start_codon:yes stop_codon:yes gene_type:complete
LPEWRCSNKRKQILVDSKIDKNYFCLLLNKVEAISEFFNARTTTSETLGYSYIAVERQLISPFLGELLWLLSRTNRNKSNRMNNVITHVRNQASKKILEILLAKRY